MLYSSIRLSLKVPYAQQIPKEIVSWQNALSYSVNMVDFTVCKKIKETKAKLVICWIIQPTVCTSVFWGPSASKAGGKTRKAGEMIKLS